MSGSTATEISLQRGTAKIFSGEDGSTLGTLESTFMSPKAMNADVLFFGEVHVDGVAHDIEQIVLEGLHRTMSTSRHIVLSLEFFETDVQLIMDEYLAGLISEEQFIKLSRAPANYEEAYRALIQFAKDNSIPVIAANAPRRYVSLIRRVGRDGMKTALLPPAQALLPPMPVEAASKSYEQKFNSIMAAIRGGQSGADSKAVEAKPLVPPSMIDAQNLWDATMAFSLASVFRNFDADCQKGLRPLVFHVCGTFHVENRLGIPEHLVRYAPQLQICSIVCTPDPDMKFRKDLHINTADFVILTQPNEEAQ